MKKKYLRRNKFNIAFIIIFVLACYIFYRLGYIDVENKNISFHQNLLTVNSIFLGFLFTSLGIMVGFVDKRIIKSLDTGGYMDNYYNSIYLGLIFHSVSTILSTVGVVIGNSVTYYKEIILIQQFSLVGGVIFFLKSIVGVLRIIRIIRKDINKND